MGCCKSTPRDPGQRENGFQDMGPRPHDPLPPLASGITAQASAVPILTDPSTATGPPIILERFSSHVNSAPRIPESSQPIDSSLKADEMAGAGGTEEDAGETSARKDHSHSNSGSRPASKDSDKGKN